MNKNEKTKSNNTETTEIASGLPKYTLIIPDSVNKAIEKHFGKDKTKLARYMIYFNKLKGYLRENPKDSNPSTVNYHKRSDIGKPTVGKHSTDLRYIIEINEEDKIVYLKYGGSHDDIIKYARNEERTPNRLQEILKRVYE